MNRTRIKQSIPNMITCLRIVFCVALAFLPLLSPLFFAVYLLAGISDILDGYLARRWRVSGRFGARLDSAADFLLCAVLIFRFLPAFSWPIWGLVWVGAIALLRFGALLVCYIRFRKIAFLHTYANKATGLLLLCFPFFLRWFDVDLTMLLLCSVASISALEELTIQLVSKSLHLDRASLFDQTNPEA